MGEDGAGLVYASLAATANATTSGFRHSIERMDSDHYLSSSYYEHWLTAAATAAMEAGLVTPQQLDEAAGGHFPLSRAAEQPAVEQMGTGAERFRIGDRVKVREMDPVGHSRCPSYTRGRVGVVVARQGTFSLPDVEAHSPRRVPEATYTVRFTSAELWGDEEGSAHVNVGLWDSYLEAA